MQRQTRPVTGGTDVKDVSWRVTLSTDGRCPVMSRWTPGYSSPITLQLVGPQSWTEVPALLCYDGTDPFAVRIAFGEVGDDTGTATVEEAGISWLLSRELLQAGLERPTGDGDVR